MISDRVVFQDKTDQQKFLSAVRDSLGLGWAGMALLVGVSSRTCRDWARGKMQMSKDAALLFSKKSKVSLPTGVEYISWRNHLKTIASKGGVVNYQKNKNKFLHTPLRHEKWKEWWETVGKKNHIPPIKRKTITIPTRNEDLAEFVGIMIGDGGISNYSVTVSLNSVTDAKYSLFVCGLIKKLFKISTKVYGRKDAMVLNIVAHSKDLVNFCQSIGLKLGNKLAQNLDIPVWILKNNEFSIACLRGLFDTDGSVFVHRYQVNGKEYFYPKTSFSSRSPELILSVHGLLKKMGFNARIGRKREDVRLESQKDVVGFMKLIGTSNPKHKKILEGCQSGRMGHTANVLGL